MYIESADKTHLLSICQIWFDDDSTKHLLSFIGDDHTEVNYFHYKVILESLTGNMWYYLIGSSRLTW